MADAHAITSRRNLNDFIGMISPQGLLTYPGKPDAFVETGEPIQFERGSGGS
jgi:hypothetical protein